MRFFKVVKFKILAFFVHNYKPAHLDVILSVSVNVWLVLSTAATAEPVILN